MSQSRNYISEDDDTRFDEVARLLEAAPGDLVAGEAEEEAEGSPDGRHDGVEVVDEKLLLHLHLSLGVIHRDGARGPDPNTALSEKSKNRLSVETVLSNLSILART